MKPINVTENSHPIVLAGNITRVVREHKRAEVRAVGALAVNQAMKGLVRAITELKKDGIEMVFTPEISQTLDVPIDQIPDLPIKLIVEPR